MDGKVFYSLEELRAFLNTLPEDVRVTITVETEDGSEEENAE